MSTRLLLVRHGQTVHNVAQRIAGWTDSALTPQGFRQVERVGRFLAQTESVEAVYASPLRRAWETALAIARPFGLTPIPDPDLRELHFGECEGLTLEELQGRYPFVWEQSRDEANTTFCWPGGESRIEFHDRVQRAFERITARHHGETLAVVAHGGVLGSYLAAAIEGEPWQWRKYTLDNCSVTEVVIQDNASNLIRCNITDFLHVPEPEELVH